MNWLKKILVAIFALLQITFRYCWPEKVCIRERVYALKGKPRLAVVLQKLGGTHSGKSIDDLRKGILEYPPKNIMKVLEIDFRSRHGRKITLMVTVIGVLGSLASIYSLFAPQTPIVTSVSEIALQEKLATQRLGGSDSELNNSISNELLAIRNEIGSIRDSIPVSYTHLTLPTKA